MANSQNSIINNARHNQITRVVKQCIEAFMGECGYFPNKSELLKCINKTSHLHGVLFKSVTALTSHMEYIEFVPATSVFLVFTEDILWSITERAKRGSARHQEMWMQIFWPDVMRRYRNDDKGQEQLTPEEIQNITAEGIKRFNQINLQHAMEN